MAADRERRALVTWCRIETARARDLATECRRLGISLEHVPSELEVIRTLVRQARMEDALHHIRVVKLDLLARLLLQGPESVPPGEIENPPPPGLSEEALAAIDVHVAHEMIAAVRVKQTA